VPTARLPAIGHDQGRNPERHRHIGVAAVRHQLWYGPTQRGRCSDCRLYDGRAADRISMAIGASAAIALTAVPPTTVPTLKVVLGLEGVRTSAILATALAIA
jgi:hypothetical protein